METTGQPGTHLHAHPRRRHRHAHLNHSADARRWIRAKCRPGAAGPLAAGWRGVDRGPCRRLRGVPGHDLPGARRRHGFAFVGRQYHFEVDGDDFYIDLLFFNWAQSRFVVIELKIGRFEPEYTGKLGFYVAWVDDENLRNHDRHSPTIGILLCAGRNDNVVRYSLANTTAPLAVADYTYDSLPAHERDAVPTARQLTDLASRALTPPDNPTT